MSLVRIKIYVQATRNLCKNLEKTFLHSNLKVSVPKQFKQVGRKFLEIERYRVD